MGAQHSRTVSTRSLKNPTETPKLPTTFRPILDRFETFTKVQDALREAGLESSQLIVGIDFTKSNEWTGKYSFQGKCLHQVGDRRNFYEQILYAVAKTLEPFDDDKLIPCYGFGDVTTHDFGVFPFFKNDVPARGLDNALSRYQQIVPHVQLSGPTDFAPLIHHAVKLVIESGLQYHLLIIIADGQVTPSCVESTQQAIVAASDFPVSIIMIGVGDGPWDQMTSFDDELPARKFDNFQFVNFNQVMSQASVYGSNEEKLYAHFALHVLMEVPDQYKEIQRMKLAKRDVSMYNKGKTFLYPLPPTVEQADNALSNFSAPFDGV